MSATIDLTKMDYFMLKRVVLRMSPESGCRLYATCRGMQEFIEKCQPLWTLTNSKLQHFASKRRLEELTRVDEDNLRMEVVDPSVCLKDGLVRIPSASVGKCDPMFLDSIVLPELKRMGGLVFLTLDDEMPAEQVAQIMEAAKTEALTFYDEKADWNLPCFDGVPNVFVYVHTSNLKSYWEDKAKIFRMARHHRNVTLSCPLYLISIAIPRTFLQTWLERHSVGSLQILTIRFLEGSKPIFNMMENIVNEATSRNLMKSCTKKGKRGFVIEREGGEAVTVQRSIDEIDFIFE